MNKTALCLLLILALMPAACAAGSDVAAVDADGVHFRAAGSVEASVTAGADGLYVLLMPVTAPLLTSQQQMWQLCHLCSASNLMMVQDNVVTQQIAFSGDDALLPETITVSARPGLTESAFRLVELQAGEYVLTLDNLTGGESDVPLQLCPATRQEALPASMSAAESQAYAVPLAEASEITFTLSGPEGCSVLFLTDSSRAQQLTVPEGAAEAAATLELPAGELIVCFSGNEGALTAE